MRVRKPVVILLSLLASPAAAQEHAHAPAAGEKLGTVHFQTSCSPAAQAPFDRAVALLHSFGFPQAIESFQASLAADPACAVAEWGIALSRWGNPFAAGIKPAGQLKQGREAVERARRIGFKTEREKGYLEAVAQLFADFEKADQQTRLLGYERAMRALAAAHPEDREAQIFHALALAAAAEPGDKSYAKLLEAGASLEKLFVLQPDHPGLAHYIIHAYDVPPLAARALDAARRYAQIAPSAPHARHMPSHTFTRVGYWQDSIDTNIGSAEVARREGSTAEELHASDYQVYAYLQTAQDAAARRLLDTLPEIWARFDPTKPGAAAPAAAGFFARAAIPARYALERGAWAEAARLEPLPSRYPFSDAMTYFARALGAARSGDRETAAAAIAELAGIHERLVAAKETYWAEQVEIERRGAAAWLALAEGRKAEALAGMRSAADLEDGTEKNAITPGPLAPARELLGEMLLQLDQPAAALAEFEATLKKEPNRFRAAYGAARSARLAKESTRAAQYYGLLLKICERADAPGRPELAEARRFAGTASR